MRLAMMASAARLAPSSHFTAMPEAELRQRGAVDALGSRLDEDALAQRLHDEVSKRPGAGDHEGVGGNGAAHALRRGRAAARDALPGAELGKAVGEGRQRHRIGRGSSSRRRRAPRRRARRPVKSSSEARTARCTGWSGPT
jgi:hypothetical protein